MLGIVGDKARAAEQSEPVDSPEAPLDRARRHAFDRQPQRIAQGGSQESSHQSIFEVMRSHAVSRLENINSVSTGLDPHPPAIVRSSRLEAWNPDRFGGRLELRVECR